MYGKFNWPMLFSHWNIKKKMLLFLLKDVEKHKENQVIFLINL